MQLERQREREDIEEEEKARREAVGNGRRGGQIQVAVAVEILRRKEASIRLVTREGEDGDLGMRDTDTVRGTTGLKTLQHATTVRLNNTSPH